MVFSSTVGGVIARRLQSGSRASSKDVGAAHRVFDVDRSKNESVVLHRLLRRIVPGHAQRCPVLVGAEGPSVRRASVVEGKTVVADSVEELVEEKRKFAVVVGMGQVSTREHSHAVAVVVPGMVARGLHVCCLAGSVDVLAVGWMRLMPKTSESWQLMAARLWSHFANCYQIRPWTVKGMHLQLLL